MTEAKVTEPESSGADTADPQTEATAARADGPLKRPWWKTRAGVAALAIALVVIAVGGYFSVNALLSHPSRQTASEPPGSLKQVEHLPAGAVSCKRIYTEITVPFNAGARGTPTTSCAFVEQVRKVYSAQSPFPPGPVQLSVVSPATAKWYKLACLSSGEYVTCTGGAAAVIYLYHG